MNIKNLYFDGDMNAAPALSGQSVGLISEIKPVKEIIEDTINEYNRVCSNLKPIT
jgi:enoyl-[acyl-carrier protein] reductase II